MLVLLYLLVHSIGSDIAKIFSNCSQCFSLLLFDPFNIYCIYAQSLTPLQK